jgi:Protein of unknown function (DUF1499)
MSWTIVEADSTTRRIEASEQSFWMGFTDDFVVRVAEAGSGSCIDVRSASRHGRSDLGVTPPASAPTSQLFTGRRSQATNGGPRVRIRLPPPASPVGTVEGSRFTAHARAARDDFDGRIGGAIPAHHTKKREPAQGWSFHRPPGSNGSIAPTSYARNMIGSRARLLPPHESRLDRQSSDCDRYRAAVFRPSLTQITPITWIGSVDMLVGGPTCASLIK